MRANAMPQGNHFNQVKYLPRTDMTGLEDPTADGAGSGDESDEDNEFQAHGSPREISTGLTADHFSASGGASSPPTGEARLHEIGNRVEDARILLAELDFLDEAGALGDQAAKQILTDLIKTVLFLRRPDLRDHITDDHLRFMDRCKQQYQKFQKASQMASAAAVPALPTTAQPPGRYNSKRDITLPPFNVEEDDYLTWKSLYLEKLANLEQIDEKDLRQALHSEIVSTLPDTLRSSLSSLPTAEDIITSMDEQLGRAPMAVKQITKQIRKLPDIRNAEWVDVVKFIQELQRIKASVDMMDRTFKCTGRRCISDDCFDRYSFFSVENKLCTPIIELLNEKAATVDDKTAYRPYSEVWDDLFYILRNKQTFIKSKIATAAVNREKQTNKPAKSQVNAVGSVPAAQKGPFYCLPCDAHDHHFFANKCKSALGKNPKNAEIFKKSGFCLRCVQPVKICRKNPDRCDGNHKYNSGHIVKTDCRQCTMDGKPMHKRICGHTRLLPPRLRRDRIDSQQGVDDAQNIHVRVVKLNNLCCDSSTIVDNIAMVRKDGTFVHVDVQFDSGVSDSYIKPDPSNREFKTDAVLGPRRVIFADGRSTLLQKPVLYRVPIYTEKGTIKFLECIELKGLGSDGVIVYELPDSLQDIGDRAPKTTIKYPSILVGTNHNNLFPCPDVPENALPGGFDFWKSRLSGRKMLTVNLTGSPN